jgi:LuxR family maltose regulon positive regulatory protein
MAAQPPVSVQDMPLLRTKLHIPTLRPEQVPRPRLVERLNAGLPRKLALVSAPAGFGKTTLLSEWVAAIRNPKSGIRNRVAWLSLDESDNDLVRFLTYFIAALRTVEANIGKGLLGALGSSQPPLAESVLTALINEIAALPDRILLVLDDYHLIEAQPIHDALTFLLRHLPLQMHLVLATREDPILPLARLRARGQLTELRAADLRFTSSEAAEFLDRVMGLDLSAEDIAALERRTEGWIAGLQLAAISLRGRKDVTGFIQSFTGSHRFVLDYLVEEVVEQQPDSVQEFLLQTAVLDRLTGSLCDAVRFGKAKSPAGQEGGQATLERLEHANLFIVRLDDERRWYRYHHLFVDLLRQRLHQVQPEQVSTLHIRASEWYEQNGFTDEAIEHALRAQDFERAAERIERVAEVVWVRNVDTDLRRWLDRLPVELVLSRPQLCVFYAWYLLASGKLDAADQALQAAELALVPGSGSAADQGRLETGPQERDPLHGLSRLALRGRIATTRAFSAFYRGDVPGIIQYARKALEYLPEQDLSWRSTAIHVLGDAYDFKGELGKAYRSRLEALEASKAAGISFLIMIVSLKLAIILRHQGQLQQVTEICKQQFQLADESGMGQTIIVGWLLAIWGEVLVELNDLDGAIRRAKKGVEITERGGDLAMLGWSYVCLIRVLFSRGDVAAAEEIIQEIERIDREYYVPPWITNLVAAWQARIWLAQDKLEAASQWVRDRALDADGQLTYLHEMEYIVLARILMAQGLLDKTTSLLSRLLEAAESGERTSRAIEILMLQALAFQVGGDTVRAMAALARALALAEPGGSIRTFVDEGPPMARLLYEALTRGISPEYIRRLLAAFPVAEPEQAEALRKSAPQAELVEPLSERELEVLHLIAEGLTNPEIASGLYLSLNTVKVHTRNLYGKLGVHNRTQAVARASDLGILSST